MGKQIDADKLIEHFINKTPNGWLVPICENESRWTLEEIISEIKHFKPTAEAIPKDQYEARLKADMVAILTELKNKLIDKSWNIDVYDDDLDFECCYLTDIDETIQQQINKLKEAD